MCGRIFQTYAIQTLMKLAQTTQVKNQYNFNPTYNMGPTNYIPAIRAIDDDDEQWDQNDSAQNQESEQPEQIQSQFQLNYDEQDKEQQQKKTTRGLDFMKWGYQTKFSLIINARVEEIHEKYTFKHLLNTKRCVVIAEGYYEWNQKKEPFMYKKKDNTALMLAAMYSDKGEVFLLTRDSFGEFQQVHNRMPVLLEDDEIDMWINSKHNSFYEIIDRKILNQQKKIWSSIKSLKIAPYVNNIKEKGEKCQMSLEEYKNQLHEKGLGKYFQKIPSNSKEKQQTPENTQIQKKKFEANEQLIQTTDLQQN